MNSSDKSTSINNKLYTWEILNIGAMANFEKIPECNLLETADITLL